MKNQIKVFVLGLAVLCGCGTTTMITSSWHKPNTSANNYHNIFVAAITKDVAAKQAAESGIQDQLQQRGITVEKSMDVFPPDFDSQTGNKKALVLSRIQSTNADGILTVALLRKSTENRYVGRYGTWNPGLRYGYYNRFWNYYNNFYYAPDVYDQRDVYYLETNLFDAKTEQLIWAAQSKTYDPSSMGSFLKGYLKAISAQMVKDGVISPNAPLVRQQ